MNQSLKFPTVNFYKTHLLEGRREQERDQWVEDEELSDCLRSSFLNVPENSLLSCVDKRGLPGKTEGDTLTKKSVKKNSIWWGRGAFRF